MFIAFEGVAGSGKTTQSKLLTEHIRNNLNATTLVSHTYEGERRKAVIDFLDKTQLPLGEEAITFLFQSLFAGQFREVKGALDENEHVIADGWRHQFLAHHITQGTFNGDEEFVQKIDNHTYHSLDPDICICLQLPPEIAQKRYLKREKARGGGVLGKKDKNYFQHVSQYYREKSRQNDWYVINSTGDKTDVFAKVKNNFEEELA
jgi:thymidylate kinase